MENQLSKATSCYVSVKKKIKSMKLRKFNEMYSDETHDYSKTSDPITIDLIKSYIKEELSNLEVDNPNLEKDIDVLANRIMYSFYDKLNYLSENYKGELESISDGSFN